MLAGRALVVCLGPPSGPPQGQARAANQAPSCVARICGHTTPSVMIDCGLHSVRRRANPTAANSPRLCQAQSEARTRRLGFVISAIDRHGIACRHPEGRCICLNVAQGVRVRCPYHALTVRHCRPSLGTDSILTDETPALFPNITDPLWSGLSHIRRTNFVLVSSSIPESTMCLERYFRLPVFDFHGIHVMTVTGK